MLHHLPAGDIAVSLSVLGGGGPSGGAGEDKCVDPKEVSALLDMLSATSQIGCCFALLQQRMGGTSPMTMWFKDYDLKPEVAKAMEISEASIERGMSILNDGWSTPLKTKKLGDYFVSGVWFERMSQSLKLFSSE